MVEWGAVETVSFFCNRMCGLLDCTIVSIHPQNADVGRVRGAARDSLTHQLKVDER
jgi:hypothetical protein